MKVGWPWTRSDVVEQMDGAAFAMFPNGVIRTKSKACACPLEVVSGLGVGRARDAGALIGLDWFDTEVVMDAADYSLRELKRRGKGAAYRLRVEMLQKLRSAHGGKLPRLKPLREP